MNILYCGDSGVEKGIALSVISLCKHAEKPLDIYILTASLGERKAISQRFGKKLEQVMKNKCLVRIFDITTLFSRELPTANIKTRFTPMCMLRLFADLVTEIPDNILYLDADVMCLKRFENMESIPLSQYDICGVPDRYGKWFFGNIFMHDYLNSGVLLMNMQRIRQNGLFTECRQLCVEKKMFMPDQTALNKLAKKLKIDRKYNCQGEIRNDTVFKHFTTFFKFLPYFHSVTVKPWSEEIHTILKVDRFDDILNFAKENKLI